MPETLFNVCQKNGLNLLQYDFNEPYKGKDQCDRESATSKSLMSSNIDAVSDMTTAEDVFTALHYGNGLKHSKVFLAEISERNTVLQGKDIKKFSYFHSVSFKKDHVILQQYYDIGCGIIKSMEM